MVERRYIYRWSRNRIAWVLDNVLPTKNSEPDVLERVFRDLYSEIRTWVQLALLVQILTIILLFEEAGQKGETWEYQCPVCARIEEREWDESWPSCEKSAKGKPHKSMSMYALRCVKNCVE